MGWMRHISIRTGRSKICETSFPSPPPPPPLPSLFLVGKSRHPSLLRALHTHIHTHTPQFAAITVHQHEPLITSEQPTITQHTSRERSVYPNARTRDCAVTPWASVSISMSMAMSL